MKNIRITKTEKQSIKYSIMSRIETDYKKNNHIDYENIVYKAIKINCKRAIIEENMLNISTKIYNQLLEFSKNHLNLLKRKEELRK